VDSPDLEALLLVQASLELTRQNQIPNQSHKSSMMASTKSLQQFCSFAFLPTPFLVSQFT
jgi:hypothetical protein